MSDGEYEYDNGGYGYDDPYGDAAEPTYGASGYRNPVGHWTDDEGWYALADAFVEALQNDPSAIQTFYADYAQQQNLRGLAEAVAASPK